MSNKIIHEGGKDEKWKIAVIIASASALILGMLLVGYCCILKARGRKNVKGKITYSNRLCSDRIRAIFIFKNLQEDFPTNCNRITSSLS